MPEPLIYLILILVAALVLFAVVSGGVGRSRPGRGRSRGSRGPLRGPVAPLNRGELATRWATIQAMAGAGGNALRNAVAEADKLFDHVLRQQGVRGDSMGDRLKNAKTRFPDRDHYDAIWRAHKLRNALAHEVGFDLVPSQARGAISDFERGLRDLGAL